MGSVIAPIIGRGWRLDRGVRARRRQRHDRPRGGDRARQRRLHRLRGAWHLPRQPGAEDRGPPDPEPSRPGAAHDCYRAHSAPGGGRAGRREGALVSLRARHPLRPRHRGLDAAARRGAPLRRLCDAAASRSPAATGRLTELMLDAARLEPGSEVLDVGCGTGAPACRLAAEHRGQGDRHHHQRGGHRDGHRTRAAAAGLAELTIFEQRDGMDNGFADASFDRVWVLESSHLMRRRDASSPSARACCGPAGGSPSATSSAAASSIWPRCAACASRSPCCATSSATPAWSRSRSTAGLLEESGLECRHGDRPDGGDPADLRALARERARFTATRWSSCSASRGLDRVRRLLRRARGLLGRRHPRLRPDRRRQAGRLSGAQAVRPPSTTSTWPVMNSPRARRGSAPRRRRPRARRGGRPACAGRSGRAGPRRGRGTSRCAGSRARPS